MAFVEFDKFLFISVKSSCDPSWLLNCICQHMYVFYMCVCAGWPVSVHVSVCVCWHVRVCVSLCLCWQNLGEAEYAVAIFMYMRLLGYSAEKITILTTYNGQKHLIRDIVQQRCGQNKL